MVDKKKINFTIEGTNWARKFFTSSLKNVLDKHFMINLNSNDSYDLNIAFYRGNIIRNKLRKTILVLNSFRNLNIDLEKEFKEVIIDHIMYPYDWSWGLISQDLFNKLKEKNVIVNNNYQLNKDNCNSDLILFQTYDLIPNSPTEVKYIFKNNLYKKLIVRFGNTRILNGIEPSVLDILKNCVYIIATNKKLYKLGRQLNEHVSLIPNGLDLNKWVLLNKKFNQNPVIGFVGNVSNSLYLKYKGYDILSSAVQKLGLNLISARFGSNQIQHDRMQEEFYSKIDILVHPTSGEGCSNTIMEALASGIPVITTRLAGFHGEFLEDKKNVIFIEKTEKGIIDGINLLKDDPGLMNSLKLNGRKFAYKFHDIDYIANRYKKVIDRSLELSKI